MMLRTERRITNVIQRVQEGILVAIGIFTDVGNLNFIRAILTALTETLPFLVSWRSLDWIYRGTMSNI